MGTGTWGGMPCGLCEDPDTWGWKADVWGLDSTTWLSLPCGDPGIGGSEEATEKWCAWRGLGLRFKGRGGRPFLYTCCYY